MEIHFHRYLADYIVRVSNIFFKSVYLILQYCLDTWGGRGGGRLGVLLFSFLKSAPEFFFFVFAVQLFCHFLGEGITAVACLPFLV